MPVTPPPLAVAHPVTVIRHRLMLGPLMACAALGAVLAAATVLIFILCRRRASRRRTGPVEPKVSPVAAAATTTTTTTTTALRRFSYGQLRRATGSFSPSHRLGQGGFGPVFRGALSTGQEVAVKLMDAGSLQGEREFQNELGLAEKMASSLPSPDRCWIVPPLGYCYSEQKRTIWQRFKGKENGDDDEEPTAARRILLVYDLMHNGSLQDALFDRRCPELAEWHRRFSVAFDIARGLQFLHFICDPPVIHGDIKPSNILLDSNLSARIADFGLARFKNSIADEPAIIGPQLDEEEVVEIDVDEDGENGSKVEKTKKFDDDTSVITITTVTGIDECAISVDRSPEEDEGLPRTLEAETPSSPVEALGGLEVASTSETTGFDRMSVDSGSRRSGRKKTGSVLSSKDWWWRQDTGGGGASSEPGSSSVKDYVMEWIRSEIKKERPKSDWITAAPTAPPEGCKLRPPEKKKHPKRLEWWASLDEDRIKKKEKCRPAREWWREEFCEELTNKHKRKMIAKSYSNVETGEQQWWYKDEEYGSLSRKKKKKSWSRSSMDAWTDGHSGEVRTTGRRSSRDLASADIPRSGTISSTPSMRGTVCYVAPEYGGGGPLSEKCDIYSFGVLILVLISGRRPLQVMASPMSEFERANLISWARHLAHLGRLFDLVDPLLRAVDRDQVLLCITVALLCIQRSPARRPSSKEIVAMLSGQSEPPNLPLEFSPSPPGGFTFKSGKQQPM